MRGICLAIVMAASMQNVNGTEEVSRSFEFNESQVISYNNKPRDYKEISNATDYLQGCETILDVGCGDGKLTSTLASHFPDGFFVGCDVSKTMIDYAKNHYSSDNLNFVERNAEDLQFSEEFDAVVSFNCLHWITNQKKALEQIFQVLRPGGKTVLVATPESDNNDLKIACRNVILSWRWFLYFLTFRSVHSFHTEKEYREMLGSVGFTIDNIRVKQDSLQFKDREELDPFLTAVVTPLQHLDPSYRPAFLEDVYQELHRMGRVDANGAIHIYFDQIEILANRK
jgi:trans-aconitate 2-methyltransferase